MYPNLLVPLVGIVAVLGIGLAWLVVRQPISRRLAARQIARRKTEALLVVTGSVLGTAIIVGALVVGDTLNHSVRQDAYRTLGPIDERVTAADTQTGLAMAALLDSLATDPDVDGVLSARIDQAAAVATTSTGTAAEPRVLAWDIDLDAAARFGQAGGSSGLGGPNPAPGDVVLNAPLAESLHVRPGNAVTLYLNGHPYRFTVARIVAERGLAGAGLGGTTNRNAYLAPGVLTRAAVAAGQDPRETTFISNRGGVEKGDALTDTVTHSIREALGPLVGHVNIETPKHSVLTAAQDTGDVLGALFLMIGSFSIIAGALLLVNIFVMLAEERKSQLGMLRAIGMKRSRLIGALTLEGSAYAVAAVLPGLAVGLGVGYGVALVAARVFSSWSTDGSGLAISFAVTPVSIVNGIAMGLIIAVATILLTSVRISRFNIIAAIRDLPPSTSARARRWLLVAGCVLAVLTGIVAVPAVVNSSAVPTLLLPAMIVVFLVPAARRLLSARATATTAAAAVLGWTLLAPVLRPRIFDTPSMAVYVVSGTLTAFSAVILVSQNQDVVLWPVRRLFDKPSETGLATRLAVAYPLAKRFRTGATLVMYSLVTLVLVLLAEISGMINHSIDRNVSDATAGYALRVDVNPETASQTLQDLAHGQFASSVTGVVPLTTALASATDPGRRTTTRLRALAVGVPTDALSAMTFDRRLASLPNDASVWQLIASNPKYVALDANFGSTGGPSGRFFDPGDTFLLTDLSTGATSTKTIAGILTSSIVFAATTGEAVNAYPLIASVPSVQSLFGTSAQLTSALVRLAPGVDPQQLAPQLQGHYLSASLVATPIAANIRRMFAASTAFFQLMQGFLALGLLVGVTGLGVVMVRAVRERRRTIGVLRALGFRSRTVSRSFLLESGLVAVEGILLGCVLGVLTTWLMYQKSAAFNGIRNGFPIVWLMIGILGAATLVASLLATIGPARRAARIKPAIAVRVAD